MGPAPFDSRPTLNIKCFYVTLRRQWFSAANQFRKTPSLRTSPAHPWSASPGFSRNASYTAGFDRPIPSAPRGSLTNCFLYNGPTYGGSLTLGYHGES